MSEHEDKAAIVEILNLYGFALDAQEIFLAVNVGREAPQAAIDGVLRCGVLVRWRHRS